MIPRRTLPALPRLYFAALLGLALPLASGGCATARMQLPADLAALEPWPVAGANPRTWNRPLRLGPWRTVSVREGAAMSWGFEGLGITTALARRPYRLSLEGPQGEAVDVACVTRELYALRGSFSVDVTGVVSPRLVCSVLGVEDGRGRATLALGRKGNRLAGVLTTGGAVHQVASVHRMEGARLAAADPVGYTISRGDRTVAAVEVVNRGAVWVATDATAGEDVLAAAAAALLLYDPEIGP